MTDLRSKIAQILWDGGVANGDYFAGKILALLSDANEWRDFSDFMSEHRMKDPDELERLHWMEAIAVVPGGKPSRLPVRYRGHPDYGWFVLDSGKPCKVIKVRPPQAPDGEG